MQSLYSRRWTGSCGGGLPAGASLSVLLVTSLIYLSAVVGGMLCKSDKPSIIIINRPHKRIVITVSTSHEHSLLCVTQLNIVYLIASNERTFLREPIGSS